MGGGLDGVVAWGVGEDVVEDVRGADAVVHPVVEAAAAVRVASRRSLAERPAATEETEEVHVAIWPVDRRECPLDP